MSEEIGKLIKKINVDKVGLLNEARVGNRNEISLEVFLYIFDRTKDSKIRNGVT